MILFGLAVAAALGCVAVSVERVRKILSVAHFELDDPRVLGWFSQRPEPTAAQLATLALEGELAQALREAEHTGLDRNVAIDQIVFEADFELSRWRMVPRMAARISSSCGFLLAAAQLRSVLVQLGDGAESLEAASEPLVMGALQIVAAALAGTSLCFALGRVAERERRVESGRIDAFLERMRSPFVEPNGQPLSHSELFVRSGVEA